MLDLPKWVQSMVREEWTAEVFDVELMKYQNIEEEMVQMLQIGMACVAQLPDSRPTMDEVVKMIEEVSTFSDEKKFSQGGDAEAISKRGKESISEVAEPTVV
ncbi:hypothetical protein L2E82_06753 [Cichorium intybus]|uniref:Uncharacterized protein n=1 Tax=Cichorium intybus TaxID=13427 RepID=A0ACB9HAX4_CICIN|nr:hypothetical protein L2E82_06753 [Cichorium intybus]